MPCGQKKKCGICHNVEPSLTLIMNDGYQYFERKSFLCPKILILPHGWQSMTLAWHHKYNYKGIA
jgi:hypothetical protein